MSDAEKVFAGFLALMVIGAAMDVANGTADGTGGSAPAPVRHCRQARVGSFSTEHGRGAISPGGATTTVCD